MEVWCGVKVEGWCGVKVRFGVGESGGLVWCKWRFGVVQVEVWCGVKEEVWYGVKEEV